MLYPKPLAALIAQFERLPGVGPKTAQRYAFTILRMENEQVEDFSKALIVAKSSLGFCTVCQNFSSSEICEICSEPNRDANIICAVAEPKDVAALEGIRSYRGRYHVLHGLLSPLEGRGPDQLRIRELLARLDGSVEEVIIATNPTVEGDATALYLAKLMQPLGIRVTRLAHGMPVGGELDYADPKTLASAIDHRREML
ncbi:MAG: recombination mediator RecR [Fimbriimonadaceae bacterium]